VIVPRWFTRADLDLLDVHLLADAGTADALWWRFVGWCRHCSGWQEELFEPFRAKWEEFLDLFEARQRR
jgi:hypothetical protein